MKATARIITGSIRAKASGIREGIVLAFAVPTGVAVVSHPTEDTGIRHFLHVAPEQPQELVWLVPQVGIDYTITTSTNLKWQIK